MFIHPALAVLSVVFIVSPSPAQEHPADTKYTLKELVRLALKDARLLEAQDARVEGARLSAAQARSWPGVSAGVLVGRTKQAQEQASRYEFSLAQPIPLSGRPRLLGARLELESESLRLRRGASEVAITLAVAKGAYEYQANRRRAAFAEQRLKRFELVSSYLSGRLFATPQRRAESRIVANRVNNLVAEAIHSEAGYKASLEKLRAYVPLEQSRYPDFETPWLSGQQAFDGKTLTEGALSGNPEVRERRLAVQGAHLDKRLASLERLPDTSLVASFETGRQDLIGTDYGLGLSLAFPSWNGNRAGVGAAEQRRFAEERELGYAERRLKAEIGEALVDYEAARQTVLKYPHGALTELEAQLEDADEGFRKGQVDLLTFLELEGSVAETFALAYDAQVELAAKAAQLLNLTADPDALTKLGSL